MPSYGNIGMGHGLSYVGAGGPDLSWGVTGENEGGLETKQHGRRVIQREGEKKGGRSSKSGHRSKKGQKIHY